MFKQNISLFSTSKLFMMGRGRGGWKGKEWEPNRGKKTFTLLHEKGIFSFKALGYIFSAAISFFTSSLSLWFPYPFILPVILHIPRLSPCSLQQRKAEMKPLRWIIYPQSKSLKSGLCHCVGLKRGEVLLCKRHATTLGALRSDQGPCWTLTQSAVSNRLLKTLL